jgi:hypothetical protein
MSFWEKAKEDKWFAFASVTLIGIVGYLGYDNYTRRRYQPYRAVEQESLAGNTAHSK